jgi:hypothetical protein
MLGTRCDSILSFASVGNVVRIEPPVLVTETGAFVKWKWPERVSP